MHLNGNDVLRCRDCRQPFVVPDGERRIYLSRTSHIPRLCRPCRIHRRKQLESATVTLVPPRARIVDWRV